jgi:hypothetical protein
MQVDAHYLRPALFVAAFVTAAAWAVTDARRRGRTGFAVVLLLALFGPLSALLWLVMRPKIALIDRPADDYDNAEDALTAAAQLDHLGEWDRAVDLYYSAAARWPEHRRYVVRSLAHIRQKESASEAM